MHPRDFVGFFTAYALAGSTIRQAGPAGAANSAAFMQGGLTRKKSAKPWKNTGH
jgi:hypothetical protein